MKGGTFLRPLVSILAGTIFGPGLSISGTIDPVRVLGFLGVASGHWDPSLVFVLAGAVMVAIPGVFLQRHLPRRGWTSASIFLPRPKSTGHCSWER